MKITYTPNPLATVVELEPHEAELLNLKLRLERYEDMMFMAHHELTSRLDTAQAVALPARQTVAVLAFLGRAVAAALSR